MMRCIKKKLCAAFVAAGVLVSLCGCFDRRELDTLGIVMGVAIDKSEEEGLTVLTVQIANPGGGSTSKQSGSSGGSEEAGSELKPYLNVSSSGRSINYTLREMQRKMSRRVYVAHNQVVVFGEELAKSGVRDCMDFFARAAEARMTVYVFVAKGKASDIFDIESEFEKMPSVQLTKILKDQKITSHAPIITEFDLVNRLVSKTTAGIAPIVSAIEDGGRKRMDVSGCAVFKEDMMVGELDVNETRGLLYVLNKVKTGVMEITIGDTRLTVEIRKARSKVKPVLYTDGSSMFHVEVEATVGIGDQSGTFNIADPDNIHEMVGAAAAEIEKEIMSAVSKSKELNADVFGFGDYLNRKYPSQWKELSKDWDARYPHIGVNVTVKAKADGSGRTHKPLAPL